MKKLYPYQKKSIRELICKFTGVLALEQGLGKTVVMLAASSLLKCEKVLIISPASLKYNWYNEIEEWIPRRVKDVEIITSGKQKIGVRKITILNYELLIKKEIHNQILNNKYDMLILDELHYLKNPKTSRTRAVFGSKKPKLESIMSSCARVYGLTGTPIPNRPIEMYPWLHAFFPEEFGISYYEFAVKYCAAYQAPWGFDVSGASNIPELKAKLRKLIVRYTKKEVLKELPPKTNQLVFLEKDKATGEILTKEAAYDRTELIKRNSPLAFEGLSELRHEMGLAKLPVCIRYITSWLLDNENDKLIIFAHHKDVIDILLSKLSKYNCGVISGKVPLKKRQSIVKSFQDKKDPLRIIIGNITSVGVGLTLTQASTAMFVEFSWVSGELEQAADRIHRIGQNRPVLIKYLVINNSLDSYMLTKIFDKQKLISEILD